MTRSPRPGRSVLWSGGLLAGTGVLGVVAVLLHSTLRPAREVDRYAVDIADAVGGLRQNLTLDAALGGLGAATRQVRDEVSSGAAP